MATITKPPILDETGQDIVTKLNNINTQVTALNALIADLGLVSITPISQADYDNLSPTDKLNGVFDIYDAVEPQIDGHSVAYDNNTDIIQAIDYAIQNVQVYTLSSQSTVYIEHQEMVLVMTDRSGMWVEGISGRVLNEISSSTSITVTRETNKKLKVVSTAGAGTRIMAISRGSISFTNS